MSKWAARQQEVALTFATKEDAAKMLRDELAHLNEVKELQAKARQKVLATMISVGTALAVVVGQLVADYVTALIFS